MHHSLVHILLVLAVVAVVMLLGDAYYRFWIRQVPPDPPARDISGLVAAERRARLERRRLERWHQREHLR